MYAILGEDDSDVEMLFTLVRRIANDPKLPIKKMGYNGCGELLIKAARQIKVYSKLGCDKFIICYDSDVAKPQDRYLEIVNKIIKKSGIQADFCALVPVQEIEAWILADIDAVTKIIPSWRTNRKITSPELQKDPKEYLEGLSKASNQKPLYSHAVHNPKIANHLNLEIILDKCMSALPLFEFVQGKGGNYPFPKYKSDSERKKEVREKLQKN
jgi:hypothetical protein